MIFLDTCAVVDFLRGDARAVALITSIDDEIAVSGVTIFETLIGIYNSKKASELVKANDFFSNISERNILNYYDAALIFSSQTKKGMEIPKNDCLIAATVLQNSSTKVVTRDIAHFSRIPGIEVITY